MKRQFLHLVNDEKFIDVAIELLEAADDGEHQFVVISEQQLPTYSFIRKYSDKVDNVVYLSDAYEELLKTLHSWTAVFLHYLCDIKCAVVNKAPENTRFVWMFWGQDAQKLFTDKNYLPQTNSLMKEIGGWSEYLIPYINPPRRLVLPFRARGKAMRRIQYCAPVIADELYIMQRKLSLSFQQLEFTYGYSDYFMPKGKELGFAQGNNILVGNSSSAASNHLDVFKLLCDIELPEDYKIILPLGYGNAKYANRILELAPVQIKAKLQPLLNYLPLEQYYEVLRGCGFAIMDHLRQQALGNIIILLASGIKLYMNEESPLYLYLVNQGYIISSTKKLAEEKVLNPLTNEQKEHNLMLIHQKYSRQVSIEKAKRLLASL